jgi:glycine dehydrogenase subunit 1
MTFNPHTDGDRVAMLEATGMNAMEEFFTPVPQRVRFPELDLPPALTELEATDHLGAFAARNSAPPAQDVYLGADPGPR